MGSQVMSKQSCSAGTAAVAGGLLCWTLTLAPAIAAPLDVPSFNRNDTGKPEVQTGFYDVGTVSAFVFPGNTAEETSQPTVLLTARIEIDVLLPGSTEAITTKVSSLMSLGKEDLDEFPAPMKMLYGSQDILPVKIDSINQQQGLDQLRAAYKTAVERQASSAAAPPPAEEEAAEKPEIQAARFDPDTMSVFVLPARSAEEQGEPTVLMTAMVTIEILFPGNFQPQTTEVSSLMHIHEEDLDEFPGPMKMLHGDQEVLTFKIDTIDRQAGLERIREAYNTAFAVPGSTDKPE
jgi:hypothetical protein